MGTHSAPRDTKTKQKLSINLTDEAAGAVRQLAEKDGITVSEVLRRAISVERFVVEQLDTGASFLITRDDGATVEKVHFVFA
ncbi:MAG: ribbon-helix-helix protein, CopG family [Actinobacteria bacterium]|nr:ribbon-helix-helix protein, CopG family [Actinomycetota bacterium]